jgi:hypothetical protein
METIPGSNVGKSVIQQVISALEDWRVNNHHLYKHVPEAQIRLQDDNRIRTLESAAKHNKPKRADSAQTLKASGASYGEYVTIMLIFKGLSVHSSSSVSAEAYHTETAAFHASDRYTPPSASTCSRHIPGTCTRHSTLYSISTSSPLNLALWTGYAPTTSAMMRLLAPTIQPPPAITTMTAAAPTVCTNPAPVAALSGPLDVRRHQQCWEELITRFKEEKLRRHTWEWESDRLLPFYTFQLVSRITDIWEEHANGLNGYLAVRDLNEYWGARWRRNRDGQRTENCRRKKVVHLVERLALKTNWDVKLALRFLRETYEGNGTTPRAFCTYLQTKGGAGMEEVMIASNSFP